jgi:hypothetical protein
MSQEAIHRADQSIQSNADAVYLKAKSLGLEALVQECFQQCDEALRLVRDAKRSNALAATFTLRGRLTSADRGLLLACLGDFSALDPQTVAKREADLIRLFDSKADTDVTAALNTYIERAWQFGDMLGMYCLLSGDMDLYLRSRSVSLAPLQTKIAQLFGLEGWVTERRSVVISLRSWCDAVESAARSD